MIAWGLSTNQWTAAEFGLKAARDGYNWAALELDDYDNGQRWAAFRDECARNRIAPGVWFTTGGNISLTPGDAHFAIAELEGPSDYDSLMAAQGSWPACAKAVITNFNTIDAARAKPLIDGGFSCITEAYLGDNPQARPDSLNGDAVNRGWTYTVPAFGVYNAPLSAYQEWLNWPHGWCVYLGENVIL